MVNPLDTIKRIFSKRASLDVPGTNVPYPPRLARTTLEDVTEKEVLEPEIRDVVRRLSIDHPRIGPDSITVEMPSSTYGGYDFSLDFRKPILKQGRTYIFWKYPDVHDGRLQEALNKAKGNDKVTAFLIVKVYEEFVKRCLRATYLQPHIEEVAVEEHIPAEKLRSALENYHERTGQETLHPINWEKEAKNAVIIKVSRRVPELNNDAQKHNVKQVPSFQIIEDQTSGENLYHPDKTLAEMIEELKIKTSSDNEVDNTAEVLRKLEERYPNKTRIVLYRDETTKGWDAEKIARELGIGGTHPIFDYEAVRRIREIKSGNGKRFRQAYILAPAAIVAAIGLSIGGHKLLSHMPKLPNFQTQGEAPEVSITANYKKKFFGNGKLTIKGDAKDSDGLDNIVVTISDGSVEERLLVKDYAQRKERLEKEFAKKLSPGKAYTIKIEATDKKGNKGVSTYTLTP